MKPSLLSEHLLSLDLMHTIQQSDSLIDPIVFAIIVIEAVAFLVQLLYYLERPSDDSRKLYLILLLMLIIYNITGGLVPNYDSSIPLEIQFSLGYITAIAMSMYFIYYIYKVFNLEHLRWMSTKGPWVCLFIPFVFLFEIPLFITEDINFSQKLLLPIPTLYGIIFVYQVICYLIYAYRKVDLSKKRDYRIYLFSVISAILCWISLPFIIFFQFDNVVEHVSTNLGLLFMTVFYIHSLVRNAQSEYRNLLLSQEGLIESQEANKTLINDLEETNVLLSVTIKNREETIQERTEALKNANEQLRNTFINLAHDTKTPLTLVNNYLSRYISKYGMNEDLSVIKYNLEKLTNDIVNFFDIERLERGVNIYDHDQLTNFSGVLLNSLSLFDPLAENKKIRIVHKVQERVCVMADPDAIVRIINNIVENAVRYTEPGGRIAVTLRTTEQEAVFKVSDSGQGIPEALRSRVLEPYFQAGQKKKGNQGIGMGLAIVNKIIINLKGTISLESNAVKGTKVTVTLPLQTVAVAAHPTDTSQHFHASIDPFYEVKDVVHSEARPYILVVEDNLAMLSYLKDNIGKHYNVYTATDGLDALQKLATVQRLDLIVSDVMMSVMDGFKMSKVIKNQQRFTHVPLLFLTAKTRKADRLTGLKLGAHDYIEKPFSIEELLLKINVILDNADRQRHALIDKLYLLNDEAPGSDQPEVPYLEQNIQHYQLTGREIEIVRLLEKDYDSEQIGTILYISKRTVTTHLQNIFKKTNVNSQVKLMKLLTSAAEKK